MEILFIIGFYLASAITTFICLAIITIFFRADDWIVNHIHAISFFWFIFIPLIFFRLFYNAFKEVFTKDFWNA